MAAIKRFEDLDIWLEARELCKQIHLIVTNTGLKSDYKLRDQIKGSSGSIMDNIAEGFERNGNNEFRQFLSIAKGSAGETRSQLYRVLDCEYIDEQQFTILKSKAEGLSGKISNFITYLNNNNFKGSKFQTGTKP
ncbi:four helix bundle protein [Niabella soli]|uniref:30S ribosomal protein S23 n=1 Tax=Niabella soli DSM 19437 TaxID=929713 RepID=W0EZI8_9BACT|nr:four helix bundle protein [Niabella soli]AHF14998.1 30S ribosomal protein S23 [Niabella soli DSM 19437]